MDVCMNVRMYISRRYPKRNARQRILKATQRNATQRNATQRNATQRTATQRTATLRNATQRNATQRNATQRNATQRNATQRNATQRNATQRNATQRNATQRNATQRNATQRNAMVTVVPVDISQVFRCGLLCKQLFADDLAIVTDSEEEVQRRWLGWQIGVESKGLKVNTGKTEMMVNSRRGTKANIKDSQGTSLRQVNKFKYLGVTISEEGGSEEAVRARVSAAWGKWRDLSGVISDKKMPRKLKIKLYMTVIR